MRWIGALALGIALFPPIAGAATPESCPAPADLHDGWQTAAPAKEGLDPRLTCAIGPKLDKMTAADPNGVVVVRNGMLVYEHYFTGKDQRWGEFHRAEPLPSMPHDANTLHDMQSVTKSVVAILVGIALDRGWLESIDAPVLSFFPQYADLRTPDKARITLRDLLTMTSGLFVPGGFIAFVPNPDRLTLDQPVEAAPGKLWSYSNGGVEVIGAILQKVSGRPLDRFAKQALFDPLGITDWQWGRSPGGPPGASWGLRLRPRDLAKIGQLVLDHGAWKGRRIVSAGWIKQMTVRHSSPPGRLSSCCGDAYGYLWWLGDLSIDDRRIDWVGGNGWGGQRLYVVPSLDLVVVVTAGVYRRAAGQSLADHMALTMAVRAALKH